MSRAFLILSICFTLLHSCKKDKEILIDGNTIPPDATISNAVKENYVNKSYISILGRKPTSTELSSGISILSQHNVSVADRNQMLEEVFSKSGYNQRLYDIAVAALLNNLDTAQITQTIYIFNLLLSDPQYTAQWPAIQAEKTKLMQLKSSVTDLNNSGINIIGLHKRCINNYFYDQLNMGTENFVVATFQHFLLRYPTDEELTQGKNMVDGFDAVLFLTSGKTKDDFISIFFNCNNYFEGQVRDLYLKYLFREPTSVEMSVKAGSYKTSLSYRTLQKEILSTNEYAGI